MKTYSRNRVLQTFAYIVLLLVILSAVGAVTVKIVLKSSQSVEKTRELEKARIALAYVNMMIRQNGGEDNIKVFDGEEGIIIENYAGVEDLNCAIFFKDGTLYEATYNGAYSEDYNEKIVDLRHMEMELSSGGLRLRLEIYGGVLERFVALRSIHQGREVQGL